jgi:hypothetical protein
MLERAGIVKRGVISHAGYTSIPVHGGSLLATSGEQGHLGQ